jgi:nitrate reductase cytochrome c-type subunit
VASATHHKWEAERNIKQCAACHRQDTCLQCHATNAAPAGGAGKMWVNPHPPDWRGSPRCQALADRNPRVCIRCHAPDDSRLSCR